MRHPHAAILMLLGTLEAISLQGRALSAQIYQARADTGRMAWGHTNYTRYTEAGYCDRAIAEVLADQRRVYVPDTLALVPPERVNAVLPAAVIAVARACGDRLTVDGADPRDLLNLARVSLAIGNDAHATAAIERMLSRAHSLTDSARALASGVSVMLRAIPARLSSASEYLKQLEGLGGPGRVSLYRAHMDFAGYWLDRYTPDSVKAHTESTIVVWKALTLREQDDLPVAFAYDNLLRLANNEGDLLLQEQILARARADGVTVSGRNDGDQWLAGQRHIVQVRKSVYGKRTRPLDGTFWINHHGVPQPAPGAISLVIRMGRVCNLNCHELYDMIRSLQKEYGTNLIVTFITETQGYLPGSGPLTPVEEAKGVADLFLKFLRLPVVVLVDELPVTVRSDGRLERGDSRFTDLFPGAGATNSILTDREGKVRWLGLVRGNSAQRRELKGVIDRALRAEASQTPTTSDAAARP